MSRRAASAANGAPADIARELESRQVLPSGAGERFSGYGVMGLPFARGHYLALRRFPASSVGPAYSSIWWRKPSGAWVIYSDVSPEVSCPRYIGTAVERAEVREIQLVWRTPWSLNVVVPNTLDWEIELQATPVTRLMSGMGRRMPERMWRSARVLGAMGRIAGPLLAGGVDARLLLHGSVPNGQQFQASPRRVWRISASRARIHGADAGPIGRLRHQTHLADVWLPQAGLFFAGQVCFRSPHVA